MTCSIASAPRSSRARTSSGRLLSREEGKTLPEGIGEVARAGRIYKFFAGEALRRRGATVDSTRPGIEVATYREPVGVFGLITPWNFPDRDSRLEKRSGARVRQHRRHEARIADAGVGRCVHRDRARAGVPKGVFNLVIGGGAAGDALTGNKDVAEFRSPARRVSARA